MDTQKLISYFQDRAGQLSQLRQAAELDDDMEFKKWWGGIESTLQRMGGDYPKKMNGIHFSPMVIRMGYRDMPAEQRAYQRGLDDAQAMLNALLEELDMWGYEGVKSDTPTKGSKVSAVTLNVTMSQKQIQEINQKIDIKQFAPDVQEQLKTLLDELKKEDKDIGKVRSTVKWLADKGTDALIAVLLASANLT